MSASKASKLFNNYSIKENIKEKAIKGASATVLSRICIYALQLVGTMVLARLLSPSDFGLVTMITVITSIMVEFGVLRLNDAIIQKQNITSEQVSTLFWINFSLCLFLTLLLIAVSPLIASFYNEPKLRMITIVASFTFIFAGISTQHLALMQRNLQFFKFAIIQIAGVVFADVIAIVMALKGFGYWAIVLRRILGPALISVAAFMSIWWVPGRPRFDSEIKGMLTFGLNSLGNYTFNYFSRNLDKFLIGWKLGTVPLGMYEKAYYLFVMPVNQLTYPLTSVALATLSRLKEDRIKYQSYYLSALEITALVGMLISAVLTVNGTNIILVLLGEQWRMAGTIFTIFGPVIGIMMIGGTAGWLHLSLGHSDRWFKWGIFSFAVTAICIVVGLIWGVLGVAAAYSISFVILMIPGLWYAGAPIGLSVFTILKKIWRYLLASLIASMAGFLIFNWSGYFIALNIYFNLAIGIMVSFFVYLSALIIFFGGVSPIINIFILYKKSIIKKTDH